MLNLPREIIQLRLMVGTRRPNGICCTRSLLHRTPHSSRYHLQAQQPAKQQYSSISWVILRWKFRLGSESTANISLVTIVINLMQLLRRMNVYETNRASGKKETHEKQPEYSWEDFSATLPWITRYLALSHVWAGLWPFLPEWHICTLSQDLRNTLTKN